jgi:hypothetical protein
MIWGIVNSQPTTDTGTQEVQLPRLRPFSSVNNTSNATARGIAAAANNRRSYVDVVKDFYWTYSKPESREEVPSIYLKEKRLKVNALVSQLKYSLGFAAAEASAAIETLRDVATDIAGATIPYPSLFLDVKAGIDTAANVGQTITGGAGSITDKISKLIPEDDNPTLKNSPWLRPYRGLYITEPTEWEFLFPYFDDRFEVQGNQFSTEGVTNAFGGILQTAGNIATEVAEIAASISKPYGITYIERAKFFNYPTDGEEVSFSFPLINTGSLSYEDVVNNWQLIFLLLYNNKPGRKSATQIEQPVIYEVEIPGVKYLPFCYITSIDIKFQGSRRELPIQIPYSEQQTNIGSSGSVQGIDTASSTKTINTVIPDAYIVNITLKSMLGNTKNFMYHMIDNGERTRVSTR